ncbi:MAG: ABC transporter permease [Anaerolineae bacterium]
MRTFIIRRLLAALPVILGVSVITFTLSHIIPGDPARLAMGLNAPEDQVQDLRERLGLNRPLPVQYLMYMNRLIHGDLGVSITSRRPVADDIRQYYAATLELASFSLVIAVILGIPIGAISAVKKDSVLDHLTRATSLLGVSLPVFWLGLILLLVFYLRLDLFPGSGRIDPQISIKYPVKSITGLLLVDTLVTGNWPAFKSSFSHILLPAFCLSFSTLARVVRISRTSFLDVLSEAYIIVARAKGLSEIMVVSGHALRNAMIPILTIIGLSFGYSLGGSVLVETIFVWPGMGNFAFKALTNLDYPAVMGVTLVSIVTFLVVNLVVDILYSVCDPRITLD